MLLFSAVVRLAIGRRIADTTWKTAPGRRVMEVCRRHR
jgi:hypothetical protein